MNAWILINSDVPIILKLYVKVNVSTYMIKDLLVSTEYRDGGEGGAKRRFALTWIFPKAGSGERLIFSFSWIVHILAL